MCVAVRVIALGNAFASDDGAALVAARRLKDAPGVEVVLAGRPGPGLLDLLDPAVPTVLLDAVRGLAPGALISVPLAGVADAAVLSPAYSSHGLGLAEALRLATALGRVLPQGVLLGIGGRHFGPGDTLDPEVEQGLDAFVCAAEVAIDAHGSEGAAS